MRVITVTMNPVLDKLTNAKLVAPEKKIRCDFPKYAAGGGGINVSRAIKILGGESVAIFLAGGYNRERIESLLKKEQVDYIPADSGENTRENLVVHDEEIGKIYRFVMPGMEIKEKYWRSILKTVKNFSPKPDYLIASGSLPPCVPDNFYAQLAQYAKKNDIRMILDTSGPALKIAMEEGVHLVKPNLRELSGLLNLNKEKITGMDMERVAEDIFNKWDCSVIVISLGAKGALLVKQNDILEYIVPPVMPVISTIGAGDSMVAGIIIGYMRGYSIKEALRYGVSAGTAAVMTPGFELCRKEETDQIFNWFSLSENEK